MRDEPTPSLRLRVLFLCTGNSCRSQMAEGWARHLKGDRIEPYSAGLLAAGLDERAIQVMQEAGVDITDQSSQDIGELLDIEFDHIVTVCDHARRSCPVFPGGGAAFLHVGFEDPPALAAQAADEQEALAIYRRVRDEIRRFIETLPEALDAAEPGPDHLRR